jgi:hypothetical protein
VHGTKRVSDRLVNNLTVIDFDNVDDWFPRLTAALNESVPEATRIQLSSVSPEFIEDAQELMFSLADREAILDDTIRWIQSVTILAYHGTRLTNEEILSIQSNGLLPLQAATRSQRLVRALSIHPRWQEVAGRLDAEIEAHGRGGIAGRRENQVHLTLSRAGLTRGFNHYLTHGSEFDQRVAYALLGVDGKDLLARDGQAAVVKVAVPGKLALDASHPHFSVDDVRARGEMPNLADPFLSVWSYKLSNPAFQSRSLKLDEGMVFRTEVCPDWIVEIQQLPDVD